MRNKFRALLAGGIALAMMFTSVCAYAEDVTIDSGDQPYLSLGADLTEDQQNTVLGYFGINSSDLSNYDVHYVTNDEEYQYLGSRLDASKIGTKALSSVVIKDSSDKNIDIDTYNINYCTEGMYRNALVTAGVSDVDVIVAGPFEISGTAGLVGVIKAYENMTGEEVPDEVIESAVDEITTTGEVGEDVGDKEGVEAIIATVKEEMAENPSMSAEEIAQAIRDAADKYGVDISEENIQKIVNMLQKLQNSGVDWDNIMKHSDSILKHFEGLFSGDNADAAKGFLQRIIDWFAGLFS